MKIIYDYRENKTVIQTIRSEALPGHGKPGVDVAVKTKNQDGDYLIITDNGETLICERKSVIDAFMSLTTKEVVRGKETNKLYRQIDDIIRIAKKKGYRPAIIIQTQCYIPKQIRVPRYEVYKRVFSALCRFSRWVTIIPTYDAKHTGHVIVKLARDWTRLPLG